MATAFTRAELLVLPAVIDVVTAGKALRLSPTLTRSLVRRGELRALSSGLGESTARLLAAVLELLELPSDSVDAGPSTA